MSVPRPAEPAAADGAGGGVVVPRPACDGRSRIVHTARLADDLASSAQARALVRKWCREWELPAVAPAAEMVVTELVENVVRHAGGGAELTVGRVGDSVMISVGDGSPVVPRVLRPAPDQPGGRGMQLVDTVASEWGVESGATGKRVWAEVSVG